MLCSNSQVFLREVLNKPWTNTDLTSLKLVVSKCNFCVIVLLTFEELTFESNV